MVAGGEVERDMKTTIEVPRDQLILAVEKLRYFAVLYNWDYPEELADTLQFGVDGEDEHDGHRCRMCDKPAGGDRTHRCWEYNDYKFGEEDEEE